MSALRDMCLAKGAVKTQTVVCGSGDDAVTVEIRSLTSGQRGSILNQCLVETPGAQDGDTPKMTTDLIKLGPMLVIAGACDPDTHEPLFTEADRDLISALDATFIDPIVKGVSELSGISEKALAGAEKNSDATTG